MRLIGKESSNVEVTGAALSLSVQRRKEAGSTARLCVFCEVTMVGPGISPRPATDR